MNEEMYQKIEQYLKGELNNEEQLLFESQLLVNDELASTFKIYTAIETDMPQHEKYKEQDAALKKTLQQLGATYFIKNENPAGTEPGEKNFSIAHSKQEPFSTSVKTGNHNTTRKIWVFSMIAVAASVLIIFGWFFLFNPPTVSQLAQRYIHNNLQIISTTLSSSKDSIEFGKNAFNNKNYGEAEKIFQALSTDKIVSTEATQYLGTLYLVTGKFDQAIAQFDILCKDSSLHANIGFFYKALALIERNKTGDHEQAKNILQQIINNDLPGRPESEEWIKKL